MPDRRSCGEQTPQNISGITGRTDVYDDDVYAVISRMNDVGMAAIVMFDMKVKVMDLHINSTNSPITTEFEQLAETEHL